MERNHGICLFFSSDIKPGYFIVTILPLFVPCTIIRVLHMESVLKEEVLFMVQKDNLPLCPVATTVSLIGSKWKLLIIRNLWVRPWRFNELKRDLEGISQKVLTDSLRSMEEDGIIVRTVYPEVPGEWSTP